MYVEPPPRRDVIWKPQGWKALLPAFLALLVILVGVGNAVIWGLAGKYKVDLKPDVLGYS